MARAKKKTVKAVEEVKDTTPVEEVETEEVTITETADPDAKLPENIEEIIDKVMKDEEAVEKEEEKKELDEVEKAAESSLESKIKEVEKQMEKLQDEIGKANWNPVHQQSGFIRTQQLTSPIPMYKLPADIQQYLKNHCFGTDVYKKGKEWLEKHNADMEMIEKLKKFISEHYN